jgi:hypothetical protein
MAPVATDFCSRLKRGYEVLDDQRRCKQNGERLEVGGFEGVGTGHDKGMWTVQELRSKLQQWSSRSSQECQEVRAVTCDLQAAYRIIIIG